MAVHATQADGLVARVEHLEGDSEALSTLASALASDLARRTDELIVEALAQSAHVLGSQSDVLTLDRVADAIAALGARGLPDNGWTAVVGWKQWSDLFALPGFADAPFVAVSRSVRAKAWQGVQWIVHCGLPIRDGVRTCFLYHRSAVGHAIAEGVVTEITPDATGAHVVRCTLRQGAGLIDEAGVVALPCCEVPRQSRSMGFVPCREGEVP